MSHIALVQPSSREHTDDLLADSASGHIEHTVSTYSDCGEEGDGWTVTNFALCSVLDGGSG